MKAIWEGITIADSNETVMVEGNHYFPSDAVNMEYLVPSETTTVCPWKGVASYYTIKVAGEMNKDACWFYPETKDAAKNIRGYLAFWRGVEVIA